MEVIVTRPHAHGVMPRNRKRPPNQSAQNSLPDGEWNDVAIAGEEPRRGGSPDEGERNQHGIWPVKRSKNCACKQSGTRRAVRFVADHRLSARHPIVFGVSWWIAKLAASQTGNTIHDDQAEV